MVFVEGVFEFGPPFWWIESDEFTRWKFLVRERQTIKLGFRRAADRRGTQ
jgi:hypothetical protein